MATLKDYTLDTGNGQKPDYLVIYFHGYSGSGGNAAYNLSHQLRPLLPNAKVRCPDGPIHLGGDSYSWFKVEDIFDVDPARATAVVAPRAMEAAKEINKYIDSVIAEEGIDPSRVILAGFSQGASMAYFAGLSRKDNPVGGIFALSGGALSELTQPLSKPPVSIAAGEYETGDYSGVPQAVKTDARLKQMGFTGELHILRNQAHMMSNAAAQLLADFVRSIKPAALAPQTATKKQPPKLSF